jgi:hypothetical protein
LGIKRVESSSINHFNVNDLYAVLKPVIKPHVYINFHNQLNSNQNLNPNSSFNVLYLGQCIIPYDTLSNASKLASIRNLIEYHSIKNSNCNNSLTDEQKLLFIKNFPATQHHNGFSANSSSSLVHNQSTKSIVNLNIFQDLIKIALLKTNENSDDLIIDSNNLNASVDIDYRHMNNSNIVYLTKSDIGFCGKIKNSIEFFAIAVLPTTTAFKNVNQPKFGGYNNFSSCLLFRYLDELNVSSSCITNVNTSLDVILNEISKIYRDRDSVFNTNLLENNNFNSFNYLTSPTSSKLDDDYSSYSRYQTKLKTNLNINEKYSASNFENIVSNLNYDYVTSNPGIDNKNFENVANNESFKKLVKSDSSSSYNSNKKLKQNDKNEECCSVNSKPFKPDRPNSKQTSLDIQKQQQKKKKSNNTEQNQQHSNGMKLIKENFTNLFLSKKSVGATNANHISTKAIKQSSVSSGASIEKQNDDDEILKTIEIETNKKYLNNQISSPSSKFKSANNNMADTSATSSSNTLPSIATSKFSFNSLNNRLSMKFSSSSSTSSTATASTTTSSKLKKVSNQFQFLKSKPPIHNSISDNLNIGNNKNFNEFFDADQVLNSIEKIETNDFITECQMNIEAPSNKISSHQSSSRLSYPFLSQSAGKQTASNAKNTNSKTNAKKILFSLLTGHVQTQENNVIESSRSKSIKNNVINQQNNHILSQQHRRLSDYHQPKMKAS